ncbi:hypothetical protein DRE_03982 [Drechslerella stenobrocha 248]|uniref:Cyanovirin-N domain-containing protein n=1 Tax=Drechslerella stenobrocha 248 TaxID=1043628 RepID=W7I2U0_9PEZI|nr:hypothetical protein DRE_03982 [Drechslerella stenobrocha 248]
MIGGSGIFLLLAGLGLTAVQASISSQCINVRLQGLWLVADCLPDSGTMRFQSSVYLQNKITNREGVLQWQTNGNYAASCTECTIVAPASLSCKCRPTWGQAVPALINLQDHIAVYNGFILSNLNGTPTPPATVSSRTIPLDTSWQMFLGNTSCYSETPGLCVDQGAGSGTTCSQTSTFSTSDGVANCFVFRWPISSPAWGTWANLRVTAPSGAFRYELFDNLACNGAVAGTVQSNELGTCKEFRKQMYAVTAIPLWNAQV